MGEVDFGEGRLGVLHAEKGAKDGLRNRVPY